jgi:hypothetical protein
MDRDSYTVTLNMFVLVECIATQRLHNRRYDVTSRQEAETIAFLAYVEGQQIVILEGQERSQDRSRCTAHTDRTKPGREIAEKISPGFC